MGLYCWLWQALYGAVLLAVSGLIWGCNAGCGRPYMGLYCWPWQALSRFVCALILGLKGIRVIM